MARNSRLTIETEGVVSRHDSLGLGGCFVNNLEWFAFLFIFEHYGKGWGERRESASPTRGSRCRSSVSPAKNAIP